MTKFITALLQWLAPLVIAYFQGKQKAELEHERETKESLADTVQKLGNRPVDRADLVRSLRDKAARQDNKPNNLP